MEGIPRALPTLLLKDFTSLRARRDAASSLSASTGPLLLLLMSSMPAGTWCLALERPRKVCQRETPRTAHSSSAGPPCRSSAGCGPAALIPPGRGTEPGPQRSPRSSAGLWSSPHGRAQGSGGPGGLLQAGSTVSPERPA